MAASLAILLILVLINIKLSSTELLNDDVNYQIENPIELKQLQFQSQLRQAKHPFGFILGHFIVYPLYDIQNKRQQGEYE